MQSCESILSVLAAWLHDMDVSKAEEDDGQISDESRQKKGVGRAQDSVMQGVENKETGLRAKFLSQIDNLRERYIEDMKQHPT